MLATSKEHGIQRSCEVLGVSRSAYYEWLGGKSHKLNAKKAATRDKIVALFWEHKRRYGARRLRADLRETEHKAGREQIGNRLREAGLKAIQPRSFVPKTMQTNPNLARSPNLLLEMDKIEQPNTVWVGDITYLAIKGGGWVYLATWMDLYTRKIVGWKVDITLAASIVKDSLQKAIRSQNPAPGLIIHSDGGGQYMEKELRAQFATCSMSQSMTRPDNHYDNAFAESLFSRFKAELGADWPFKDFADAHLKTFEYIEGYYNGKRRHSSLGYLSPQAFENNWIQSNDGKEQ